MRLAHVTVLGLVVGSILGTVLGAMGWLYARMVSDRTTGTVAAAAASAQPVLGAVPAGASAEELRAVLIRLARQEGAEFSVHRPDGSLVTSATDSSGVPEILRRPPAGQDGPGLRVASAPLLPPNGMCATGRLPLRLRGTQDSQPDELVVRVSCNAARSQVLTAWAVLTVLWVASLVCCLLPELVLRHRWTRALHGLRRTLSRIADGAFHLRTDTHAQGHDLNLMAADINRLAAVVQSATEEQHSFLADVAHQLRNPLITLRLRIENIRVHLPDEAAERHAQLLRGVDRLDRTLTDMLEHAHDRPGDRSMQVVDVCAVVEECVREWAGVAEQRMIRLQLDRPRHAWALARPGAVEQAMNVLLDNALKYSPEGSVVRIGISGGSRLEVRVSDEGPGMTAAQCEAALQRGWRGDERSSHGIGLSIAAKLIASSGGRLELLPGPGRGLSGVLRLARALPDT